VIDECHRGSARDDSNWCETLQNELRIADIRREIKQLLGAKP
jgi:superfamily II DNA or RNA helicase